MNKIHVAETGQQSVGCIAAEFLELGYGKKPLQGV